MNEDEYKQVSYISHNSNYFIAKDKNFIVVLKKSWIKIEKKHDENPFTGSY